MIEIKPDVLIIYDVLLYLYKQLKHVTRLLQAVYFTKIDLEKIFEKKLKLWVRKI